MIAALASGLLGQIEGMGSVANGASSIASLFTNPAQSTPPSTPARHGAGLTTSTLSDQLQSLLLQQQSQTTNAVALDADATPAVTPAANIG